VSSSSVKSVKLESIKARAGGAVPLLVAVGAVLAALALTGWAQFREFRGGRRGPPGSGPVERGSVPMWGIDERFPRDLFTFARLKYRSSRPERTSYAWWTDHPKADLNLSYRLHQLSSLAVNPEPKVVDVLDPELFDYPWVMMSGAGNITLSEPEATTLRRYLLSGGFLWVDDFWGQAEWDGVYAALKQVLPDREPVDLPRSHPLFHFLFDLPDDRPLQTPNLYSAVANRDTGITWEDNHAGGNTRDAHFRAVFDSRGRLLVMLCHNTDNGDGWEEEGADPWFFREFSENKNYPLAFNLIFYMMTH